VGDTERVREVWNQPTEHRMTAWTEHPFVRAERLNRKVSGSTNHDCHQWFLETARELGYTFPVASALSLGCGFGDLERGYSQYDFAVAHEGIDIAEAAVAEAARLARAAGFGHITYRAADLNSAELPEASYDIVLAHQSVHHIEHLEHLAAQVHRTLKPGGLFMMNEYVGPNRLQMEPSQQAFADVLFSLLPDRYLMILPNGSVRRSIAPASADEVAAHDPSEAVRSEDIVPIMEGTFQLIARRDYGGNILQHGLDKIVANFRDGDPLDNEWLSWLFRSEDCLLAEGAPSSFAVFVYRKL
jgi:SAM-dependent methyltransferase